MRRFRTLDVFTDTALAGNPLAVVLDADGLDDARMQAIAREFNLSETVFVRPAREARHLAALRIFTPARELPFAGHPVVGTAVLLALEGARAADGEGEAPGAGTALAAGLELSVGVVPVVVELRGEGAGRARFRLPKLPSAVGRGAEPQDVAEALRLEPRAIGFERHRPSLHDAGVPYHTVPLASLEALAAADPDGPAFERAFATTRGGAAYLYARDPDSSNGLGFRARMFAPAFGMHEDPATGSAAAAFAGALMRFERLGEGTHDVTIRQGVEMGRPSLIELQMVIREGALASAEIGGEAVLVSRGELVL